MNVGERLIYFRELRGYTTNKLANEAGISQSFLRDVELSKKNITVEYLSLLCDALKITLKDFFDYNNNNSINNEQLLELINKLSSEQKTHLAEFLKYIR